MYTSGKVDTLCVIVFVSINIGRNLGQYGVYLRFSLYTVSHCRSVYQDCEYSCSFLLNMLCISGTVDILLVIVFASINTVSTLDQNDVYLRYS